VFIKTDIRILSRSERRQWAAAEDFGELKQSEACSGRVLGKAVFPTRPPSPSGPIEVNGFNINLLSRGKRFTIEKDLPAISGLNRLDERFAQIDVTLEADIDLAPKRTVLDYSFTGVVLQSIAKAAGDSPSVEYGFSYASLTMVHPPTTAG
jgi:hypothetical protein